MHHGILPRTARQCGESGCRDQRAAGADVRFGSLADIAASPIDVRFTPESGHWPMLGFYPTSILIQFWLCRSLGARSSPSWSSGKVLTGAINRSGAYKISEAGLLVCGEKGVNGGTWLLFYRQPPPGGSFTCQLDFPLARSSRGVRLDRYLAKLPLSYL